MDKYIGKLLDGRYEVLEILGVGGMAVVYKARCRILNRFVAIKILKDEYAQNEEFRKRFYIESQAVAKLSHNNIVSVYDVSHTPGLDYIVMELIEGITLKEYLEKKGRLPWQETLFFTEQIARALEHAHSRGIIHQDIKPQNVIILQDGTAKVTDFGIASFASNQETRVIQEAIGSVHYISPEQAKGSRLDYRTDLYSLGVVMYEMLTGQLPFTGETPLAIVMQHINAMPLLPSEIVSDVPHGMDQVVMHAMCPTLSQRYSTASEMIDDLEQLQEDPNTVFPYSGAQVREDTMAYDKTQAMPSYNDIRRHEQMKQVQKHPQQRRPQKKKGFFASLSESPVKLTAFVVGCIVLIAVVVGSILMFGGSGTKKYQVPTFVGQNLDEVLSGQYQGVFDLKKGKEVASSEYAAGEIVAQSVAEGQQVPVGTTITLDVSTGPDGTGSTVGGVTVSDYSGQSRSDVESALKQAGISYVIKKESSDDVSEGEVIRTDPAAGETLQSGGTLTVYVSSGPKSESTAQMPNVVGMSLKEAKSTLSAYGLTIRKTKKVQSSEAEGTVVTQSIEAGTEVNEGDRVTLEISSGVSDEDSSDTSSSNSSSSSKSGSATISVAIPESAQDSSAHIVVKLDDGSTAYDETKSSPGSMVSVTIKGSGSRLATVYVNGEQQGGQTPVTFN